MQKSEVLIQFTNLSAEEMEHLHRAEEELRKAGITFDTGFGQNTRDWEFDFSLRGKVEVFHRCFGNNLKEIGSDVVLPDPECRG